MACDALSIVIPEGVPSTTSTCRICYSTSRQTWISGLITRLGSLGSSFNSKHLIRPCLQCKGSIGAVHNRCLEKWLAISKSDKCDVCKSKLIITKYPKDWRDWIKECDKSVKCYIATDILSFLFLTPITVVSIYLCVRGLILHASSAYEVSILLLLILLVLIPYFAWLTTCLYQHYECASDWCRNNFTFKTHIPASSTHTQSNHLPQYKLSSESSSVTPGNSRSISSSSSSSPSCNSRAECAMATEIRTLATPTAIDSSIQSCYSSSLQSFIV